MTPDENGYFGRAIPYTDLHTQDYKTYYDLEITMESVATAHSPGLARIRRRPPALPPSRPLQGGS